MRGAWWCLASAVLSLSSSAVVMFFPLVPWSTSTHLRSLRSHLSLRPTSSTTLDPVSVAPSCCPFLPTFFPLSPPPPPPPFPSRPNFLPLAAVLCTYTVIFSSVFFLPHVSCLFVTNFLFCVFVFWQVDHVMGKVSHHWRPVHRCVSVVVVLLFCATGYRCFA
jgi:hypothetical protein